MKIKMTTFLVYQIRYDEKPAIIARPGDEFEVESDEGIYWLVKDGQNIYAVNKNEATLIDEVEVDDVNSNN